MEETGRHRYDILRKHNEKSLIWLEEAADLEWAELRVKELLSFWPGEYQVFDLQTKQVVLNAASPLANKSQD
jgi:hypothetical protein